MRDFLGLLKWLAGFSLVLMVLFPAATLLIQFGGVALSEYHARQERHERVRATDDFRKKYEHVVDFTKDTFALQSYDRFGELVPSRSARILLAFPKDHFSDASWQDAVSAARLAGPDYAEQECEALLRTVASQCRASETTVSPWTDSIQIRISLQFVQRPDLGKIPKGPKLRLDKIEFDYGGEDREKVGFNDASRQRDKRILIYSNIARDCEAVKLKYGNCSIYVIRIDSRVFTQEGARFVHTIGTSTQSILRPLTES